MHTGQAIRAESLRKSGVNVDTFLMSKPPEEKQDRSPELSDKVSNGNLTSDLQTSTSSEKDQLDDDWVKVGAESKVEIEMGSKVKVEVEPKVEVGTESKVEVEEGSNMSGSSEHD